jgi:hypothetical protein
MSCACGVTDWHFLAASTRVLLVLVAMVASVA